MNNERYQKLKQFIYQDKILLLPHKKYIGNEQIRVYSECALGCEHFEKLYNNGDVILQIGELGPRIGPPLPWWHAIEVIESAKK